MSINSVVNDLVTSVSVINALKPLPPTISGYSVAGKDDLALDPAGGQTVQINGTGFLPGATITFDGSAVAVVTYVNPNQLTFTSPAKTAGTYTIYAVNPDGGTAIYVPGIIYSTLPTWTTAAGSLGSYYETTSISNTVVAAGDAPVTYSLFSGSLPTGSTLAANGVITGTAPVDSSSTTYSFTIQASDAQLQDSTRSFSLTINVDAVTWVSPANATTYTSAVDSAIATVTLNATDAAGYAVSYSANALPTGLSLSGANITGTPTVIADSSTLLTATAATTNRTAVRTINWSITVANDPYFEYNTLLIPGASTTFVDDASTNNFAVTINGDTKPNNFNPYTPGYYSNYFDGNGDFLTVPNNAALAFGSGDFCLEFWIYTTAFGSTDSRPLGNNNTWAANAWSLHSDHGTANEKYTFWVNNYNSGVPMFTSTSSVVLNIWTHVAITRSGTSWRMFVNGVQEGSTVTSSAALDGGSSDDMYIGGSGAGNEYVTGYMSNVRAVKGAAVYTSNFTPSTTPLTSIANTSLLTCQSNRFIDNSTNNFTLTVAGNTSISSFDPFVPNTSYSTYGSGYFDGTGDYLTVEHSTAFNLSGVAFTIEAWVYTITSSGYRNILTKRPASAGPSYQIWINNTDNKIGIGNATTPQYSNSQIATNTWNHVAWTYDGSATSKMWINGVLDTTVTLSPSADNANPITIGAWGLNGSEYFNGYITDVRIVKGAQVYTTAFTPPTAPLTAITNTQLLTLQNNQSVNNNIFLDNSTNNFFVTRNGNTTQGTFSPYGGNWSNYFNGSSSLALPSSSQTELTTNSNFTFEAWVYLTGYQGTYNGIWGGNGGDLVIAYSSTNSWGIYPALSGSPPFMYSGMSVLNGMFNRWAHVAITRSGNSWNLWVDGTSVASATLTSTSIPNTTKSLGSEGAGANPMLGYISNARYTSAALYTTTFTPPTTPVTTTVASGIVKLLTCQSNRLIDNSINNFTVTKNGDTSVQRFSPFNPSSVTPISYSGYFDGTGDYLTIPASTILDVGNTSWTIECWVYMNNTTGTQMIVGYNNLSATDFWDLTVVSGVPTFKRRIGGSEVAVSGGTISANIFTNVTVVRNGTAVTIYLNGSSVATNANVSMPTSMSDQILGIGANRYSAGYDYYFNGFISNLRMVKGTAVYTSNFTPSTTPLTAIANTSLLTLQSPTFIDNSTNNFTITAVGNSQPSIQNPFGFTSALTNGYTVSTIGGSGYFDGTGDYLQTPTNITLSLSTSDFTLECWAYISSNTANYPAIISNWADNSWAANKWTLHASHLDNVNKLSFYVYNINSVSAVLTSTSTITFNIWNHFVITRLGTALRMFVNGVLVSSATSSASLDAGSGNLIRIGASSDDANSWFNGFLSNARIVKGTALYTSNFVPPSAPLTAVQNTVLLNNMTSAGVYDAAMMNNMETVGDAKLSTAVSKFGGSSMAFDGTGDYMVGGAFSNPIHSIGSGDFTIEMWLYTNANKAQILIDTGTVGGSTTGIQCALNASGYPNTVLNNSIVLTSSILVSTTTWTHVAWVRSSGTLVIYVNGVSGGSVANSINISDTGLTIGTPNDYRDSSSTYHYNGYIDDLRITRGYARYTSNFTPPTTAFPVY